MAKRNIVVMGGSFNPPTIAHLKLIQAAMDALDAEAGYLVPVSYAYLKRKLILAGSGRLCIDDAARLEMLRAMCAGDGRIRIWEGELHEPFAITERTMALVQQAHPEAAVYFVAGADKLDLLESFVWKWDFLYRYRAVVFSRNGDDLEDRLRDFAGLTAFRGSIAVIEPPEGIGNVSSTAVREHLFDPDAVADMLHPAVLPLVRALREQDFPEEILQFKGDFDFLSTLYPAAFTYDGIPWRCAEAAFQASKSGDPAERLRFSELSPDSVRQKGSRFVPRPGWEAERPDIMRAILREVYAQNPMLRERLLATGSKRLINGTKKDRYWGFDLISWEGENRLGRLLTQLRQTLRNEVTE